MKSVVLLSGGLDSAVALAMEQRLVPARRAVEALTVDYGQRHNREIYAAHKVACHYGVPWRLITLDPKLFGGSTSALLDGGDPVPEGHAEAPDATYVPARNTLLLTMAAVRAEILGVNKVVIGANADDAGAYPDCRADYLNAFRDVLIEGTLGGVWIDAPLLYMTKQEVIAAAQSLNVPVHLTWSCYEGMAAGPCGRCGACQAREVADVPGR